MSAFSCKIPNGKYLAKLYFAETYAGITGPGQRVFSFTVQGHEFKDFDIWVKAGGPRRAYIETVPVEVTNGEFRIVFTPQVENPAINAIEIVPQTKAGAGAAPSAATIRIKAGLSTPFTDSSWSVFGSRIRVLREVDWAEWSRCPAVLVAAPVVSAAVRAVLVVVPAVSAVLAGRPTPRPSPSTSRAAAIRATHRQGAHRCCRIGRQVPLAV